MHRLALLLCLSLLAPAIALGQPGFPCAITAKGTLEAADLALIARLVNDNQAGLVGDPLEIKKSRDAILSPLALCPGVSVQFRIEYAKAVMPVVESLLANPRPIVVANALRILGELATSGSVPLVTKALESPDAGTRFAACVGASRAFDAVRISAPALAEKNLDDLLKALVKLVPQEKDPLLVDGAVLALIAGTKVPYDRFREASIRAKAVSALAIAAGERARAVRKDPALQSSGPALVRAGAAIRDRIIEIGANQPLDRECLIEAAGLGGDLVALVSHMLKNPPAAGLDRALMEAMAAAGENCISLAAQQLGVQMPPLNLGPRIKGGGDAQFQIDADKLIGPNGLLTKPPFSFKPERFKP